MTIGLPSHTDLPSNSAGSVPAISAGGKYLAGRPTSPKSYYEAKYQSPTGLVFDLTHTGWAGAVKDVVPAKEPAPAK